MGGIEKNSIRLYCLGATSKKVLALVEVGWMSLGLETTSKLFPPELKLFWRNAKRGGPEGMLVPVC